MNPARLGLVAAIAFVGTSFASAQVKEPPRPEKLDIQVRYRIRADRDERIRQFRVLEKNLAALGFEDARRNDPNRDLDILDPGAERFTGTIPSAKVLDVLNDPRVQTILFAQSGYSYPDSSDKPVPIRVVLRDGLPPLSQQTLHGQALAQLEQLGFRDALGYDTRGYTQLKGTIPLKNLDRLVKDLRGEPAGWFVPATPVDQLPRPFVDRNPVRWVEVMPAGDVPPPFEPERLLPARAKLTPDLRAVLVDPAAKDTPLRVIIVFAESVENRADQIRSLLASQFGPVSKLNADGTRAIEPNGLPAMTEGAALDGAVGNIASIRFDRPSDAEKFAFLPGVLSLRLPRKASETMSPLPPPLMPANAKDAIKASGVEALHMLGYTGTGVKIAVVGSDFTGAEALIGSVLPKKTRILDLTTELNPEIVPSPSDPNRAGNGTAAARAVALTAPDAELVLVRIDPGAIFQLFGVIRVVRGEATYSEALRSRLGEIQVKTADLTRRKTAALDEHHIAFSDLSDDERAIARRAKAQAALNAILIEQTDLAQRIGRFNAFQKAVVEDLLGTRVIVNTLEWESGFPLDGVSLLSRTLDQMATPLPPRVVRRAGDPASAPKLPIVWVQAASAARNAVWGGPFLDTNRDGTMEFAPPSQKLPPGNWSADMNFLALQSADGTATADLPAGGELRFTMQWRESLDPNFPSVDRPAYPVVLRLFRQLDPNGEKRPSDEMAEDARTGGGPYPILLTKTFVVYEQTLEFTMAMAGRYALIVATGYQPDPLLPALRREIEVYPRIVVETLTAKPGEAHAVFQSYVTPGAGVGVPGDSPGAVTVGIPVPGELFGGGTGVTLLQKPDIFGPETVDVGGPPMRGQGIATGYVGGMAGTLVQAGASGANVFRASGFAPGGMSVVPQAWLRYLKPIAKPGK